MHLKWFFNLISIIYSYIDIIGYYILVHYILNA